ncbi:MAG: hypothetical protein HY094_08795 [Candidatus Melainabacteria bacterium]|nr:hypothetical protein [Candidatus Melainabacteria bacterium]
MQIGLSTAINPNSYRSAKEVVRSFYKTNKVQLKGLGVYDYGVTPIPPRSSVERTLFFRTFLAQDSLKGIIPDELDGYKVVVHTHERNTTDAEKEELMQRRNLYDVNDEFVLKTIAKGAISCYLDKEDGKPCFRVIGPKDILKDIEDEIEGIKVTKFEADAV